MNKIIFTILIVLAMEQIAPCQNLLNNNSFEARFDCPTNNRNRFFVLQNNIFHWVGPLSRTSYFNTCATYVACGSDCTVPVNWPGYQNARTGDGYIGVYTFRVGEFRQIIPFPGFDFCEDFYDVSFAWSRTKETMIPQKKYYVEYYTSLSDSSLYARNTLGMGFSVDTPRFDVNIEWPVNPFQLINDTVSLTDKVNWQHLQWIFEADSAYDWITIGPAQKCPQPNDTVYVGGDNLNCLEGWTYSFYYIDDVGLYEIQGSNSTQTFCGNTASLSTPLGSFNHIWSNGGRTANTTISGSGTYTVFYRIDSLAISDTINVEFMPTIAENFLGADTVLLVPQSTISLSGPAGYSYSWNTGSTVRTLDITSPGTYWLTVTDQNGCMTTDTVVVVFDTSVGINNFWKNTDIQIYPNPAKEILYIKLPDLEKNSKFNFEICNSQGQVVLSLQNKVSLDKIDISNLSDGIYLLKALNTNTHEIFSQSFVVKR